MIGEFLDRLVSAFNPLSGLRRAQARRLLRGYAGAELNRLNNRRPPQNRAADQELMGPFGADAMRARARMLVRDNAWAWGVVDTIVSSVVGTGIGVQSMYETPAGGDVELINEKRDRVWDDWAEVCELNGQMTFAELQALALREIVEAGEVLIHLVTVPREFNGVSRPIPLALELIEADRLASEQDRYFETHESNRIVRGVELDELGKPVAYWIYPNSPNGPHGITRNWRPERIPAANILHLFRRDRVGQTRGVSWFAPVVSWLSDLGVYVDNELQASAVASCFAAFIKTDNAGDMGGVPPTTTADTSDTAGNLYTHLQPGMVSYLNPNESIEFGNPTRPNSASEPWINLMLRGIAVGTGLSYEIVARDFSQTNYSSNRASQLEDRRRFRRWQRYLISHLCQPVWDRFCEAAALTDNPNFPAMADLLDNRRACAPAEFMPPTWEWVDPVAEQQSTQAAIDAFQSTYQEACGALGKNYRHVFYQRAKEERLKKSLGLVTPADATAQADVAAANSDNASAQAVAPSGEFSQLSTQQFNRNRKAINKILDELVAGVITEARARTELSAIGIGEQMIETLIADAADGSIDTVEVQG